MKRHRRLRRLTPDAELFRRRAAGETVRELAPDYGVSHTTLSRFFARPEAGRELKRAERLHRAGQKASEADFRAQQRAAGARLEPGSADWLAWYEARRLRSYNDFLNCNDAPRRHRAALRGPRARAPPSIQRPLTGTRRLSAKQRQLRTST